MHCYPKLGNNSTPGWAEHSGVVQCQSRFWGISGPRLTMATSRTWRGKPSPAFTYFQVSDDNKCSDSSSHWQYHFDSCDLTAITSNRALMRCALIYILSDTFFFIALLFSYTQGSKENIHISISSCAWHLKLRIRKIWEYFTKSKGNLRRSARRNAKLILLKWSSLATKAQAKVPY